MRTLRPLDDQSGIALVMALMVMMVLTITISTTIMYSTQAQHESGYGKAKNVAYVMAENGINNAMAVLRMPPDLVTGIGNNALDKTVFCGVPGYVTGTTNPCTVRNDFTEGYVVWSGSLNQATSTWTITSIGYVANPSPREIVNHTWPNRCTPW